jgi:hypothetical protein
LIIIVVVERELKLTGLSCMQKHSSSTSKADSAPHIVMCSPDGAMLPLCCAPQVLWA